MSVLLILSLILLIQWKRKSKTMLQRKFNQNANIPVSSCNILELNIAMIHQHSKMMKHGIIINFLMALPMGRDGSGQDPPRTEARPEGFLGT